MCAEIKERRPVTGSDSFEVFALEIVPLASSP